MPKTPDVASGGYNFRESGKGKKTLSSINVKRAANGGFMLAHSYESTGPNWMPDDQFVFSADEGGKLLSHIGKQLGIKGSADEASEPEHK